MRRLTAGAASAVLLGTAVVGPAPAAADGDCPFVDRYGVCLSDEAHPPEPSSPSPSGGDEEGETASTGRSSSECSDASGRVIPCTDEFGFIWVSGGEGPIGSGAPGGGCYGFVLDQQPAPNSPLWQGNDPSAGSIWSCDPTVSVQGNTWFVPDGEQAAPQIVDAAGIAEAMLARAPFEVADLRMAPPYNFHTYIRIENWFWVPEGQWHEVSLTESVGPASVTLTATPSQLVVDTGDDPPAPTRCYDAGRPWVKGMSDAAQTTCSHAYASIENPQGDSYTVSGQLLYEVSWSCTGRCSAPAGDLGEHPAPESDEHQVEVRQRQTVVTGQ